MTARSSPLIGSSEQSIEAPPFEVSNCKLPFELT
jgi:hypothetical protein